MLKTFYPRTFPGALSSVCVDEPKQMAAWCRYFGVFGARLREAVRTVGPAPDAVRAFLQRPRDIRLCAGGRCLADSSSGT